jgi:predicted lipoprotein with Yx(FWY)xxD motif
MATESGGIMRKHVLTTVMAALLVGLGVAAIAQAGERAMTEGPALTLHKTPYGRVVFDGHSRALYLFGRDKHRSSTCYGSCASTWPPFIVRGKPRAGAGVRAGLIGTTRRRDGKLQVTYGGHPLYYYKGDPKGQAKCQGVRNAGGIWLVVGPNGKAVR